MRKIVVSGSRLEFGWRNWACKAFTTGVVYLVYAPDPNPPTGSYDEAKESLPQE